MRLRVLVGDAAPEDGEQSDADECGEQCRASVETRCLTPHENDDGTRTAGHSWTFDGASGVRRNAMFYTQQVLSRKGSLGTIWIAAHLDKKLKRRQISETDIRESVDLIMHPEAPFALRLSSQLLFGLVRVYRRQVTYLLQDCNEALSKLHDAFVRTTLPEMDEAVALKSLTLPENFFNLTAMEMSTFCGILADAELEDESMSEAILPSELFKNDELSMNGEVMPYRNDMLDMGNREMPPLMEIIPEEEMIMDPMRAHSSLDPPRMSSFAEPVIQDSRKSDVHEAMMHKASLSLETPEVVEEIAESIPKTPERHSSQQPPMLPDMDMELPVDFRALEDVQGPDQPEKKKEEMQAVSPVLKNIQKKHRVMIDKKTTVMSGAAYRKMHQQTMKETLKTRNVDYMAILKRQEEWIEQSSIKYIRKPSALKSIWQTCIRLPLPSHTEDLEIELEVERAEDDIRLHDRQLQIPILPSQALERDSLRNLAEKSVSLSADKRTLIHSLSPEILRDQVPAGEESSELPPVLDDEHQTFELAEEDIRPSSQRVLTHLKRRFTELADEMSPVEEITERYPSPKRRRLPSVAPPQSISMFDVMKGKSRMDASRWFYELLALKSNHLVKLEQSQPYGDIQIQSVYHT